MSLIEFLPHMDWPQECEPEPKPLAEPWCPACEELWQTSSNECPHCEGPLVEMADVPNALVALPGLAWGLPREGGVW